MFIEHIKLENLLSFGPDTEALELRPLNVLIGPNGSGKSNLIEAIGLLKATPQRPHGPNPGRWRHPRLDFGGVIPEHRRPISK